MDSKQQAAFDELRASLATIESKVDDVHDQTRTNGSALSMLLDVADRIEEGAGRLMEQVGPMLEGLGSNPMFRMLGLGGNGADEPEPADPIDARS